MATTNPTPDVHTASAPPEADLLVLVGAQAPELLESVLSSLTSSLAPESLLIASPDVAPTDSYAGLRFVASNATSTSWTLTAADFVNAHLLAQKSNAHAVLLLGSESGSMAQSAVQNLANAALHSGADLIVSRYDLPPRAGLVNSAILYPLSRALFATRARFPLAIDLGLSRRMAERLAAAAQRFTAANQGNALVWPIEEAAVAGFSIQELHVGTRTLPAPPDPDLNTILPLVTGSLFADIESKAAFWQRARTLPPARELNVEVPAGEAPSDIAPMLDAFRLAYVNLREIWSLVLPPNSLLGLKRLSITDSAAFRMPDALWARIVYDFLLAYRLRTINRGHLLGALIPLYLAWAASHINITASGTEAEEHVEALASAFEAEKPYLVSRWRWPDRFNP